MIRSASCAFLLFAAWSWAQPVTVIQGGSVIDGAGTAPRAATVVIRGSKIEAVGPDAIVPAGATVIDATGKTVLPGFFDLHTHLTASPVSGIPADWGRNAMAYLAVGVTTVNDFAEYTEMYAPMRALFDGRVEGPHVHFAARFSTPGGHGAEGGWGDFITLTASTPEEGRARIRDVLPAHPDVIKIFTDGWRYGAAPDLSSMNLATLSAMVQEAHAAHLRVFTHTVTLNGAKIAARAGVDVLAHGVGDAPVDDELIALMKEHGTVYVPTLSVYQNHDPKTLHPLALELLSPAERAAVARSNAEVETPQREVRWRNLTGNMPRLHDAGINVAIGTDAGMAGTYHGYATLNEIELFAAALGPLEALRVATSGSARALGIEGERGTLAAGMAADVVILDGHPETNIRDIEKLWAVFRDGQRLDLGALRNSLASGDATKLPMHAVPALIDDMERPDGRTALGTLRIDSEDSGSDHSHILFNTVPRAGDNHALLIQAAFSPKPNAYVRVEFPLTPGAVEPVDASAYAGVSFDARGSGKFRLLAYKSSARKPGAMAAPFDAGDEWKTFTLPLAELKNTPVNSLAIELSGPGESKAWLELDNLRFVTEIPR